MNNATDAILNLDHLGSTPGVFDFSLLFEETILTIAPASLFLVAGVLRTTTLYGSPVKVQSTWSRQLKVV